MCQGDFWQPSCYVVVLTHLSKVYALGSRVQGLAPVTPPVKLSSAPPTRVVDEQDHGQIVMPQDSVVPETRVSLSHFPSLTFITDLFLDLSSLSRNIYPFSTVVRSVKD